LEHFKINLENIFNALKIVFLIFLPHWVDLRTRLITNDSIAPRKGGAWVRLLPTPLLPGDRGALPVDDGPPADDVEGVDRFD
jgi:hypothetical protein